MSPTRPESLSAAATAAAANYLSANAAIAAESNAVRPFILPKVPQAELDDLRRRIAATRWPDRETVPDATQGVQLDTMQKLARYWEKDYDWRKIEAKLASYPQFVTEIDGLDIHFIHVRSKHENALPIIITHGWPGSIIEQLKLIGPLTDPTAYGGTARDAFDVVIPSMAGYGYSGKPTAPGWDTTRMARAWAELMPRLGYNRYVAQGGDAGGIITEQMGALAPPELLAIHTNLPFAIPAEILAALPSHQPPPGLSDEERQVFERLDFWFTHGLSYAQEMQQRPQTLYAIADSPVGLAAWFLDHDILSYELIARVFDGKAEGLTRDDVLDNITLTWLTNTAISAARMFWEYKVPFFAPLGVEIPVAVSTFPDELYQLPKNWAERAYPNLIFYNKPPNGGHFAAWEQPKALSDDVRAAFRTLH